MASIPDEESNMHSEGGYIFPLSTDMWYTDYPCNEIDPAQPGWGWIDLNALRQARQEHLRRQRAVEQLYAIANCPQYIHGFADPVLLPTPAEITHEFNEQCRLQFQPSQRYSNEALAMYGLEPAPAAWDPEAQMTAEAAPDWAALNAAVMEAWQQDMQARRDAAIKVICAMLKRGWLRRVHMLENEQLRCDIESLALKCPLRRVARYEGSDDEQDLQDNETDTSEDTAYRGGVIGSERAQARDNDESAAFDRMVRRAVHDQRTLNGVPMQENHGVDAGIARRAGRATVRNGSVTKIELTTTETAVEPAQDEASGSEDSQGS